MAETENRFLCDALPLDGLRRLTRQPATDDRGVLARIFDQAAFSVLGIARSIAQINHSVTRCAGTVRGLHFQYPPYAEAKLVSCLRGEIFDVAVDIRRTSETFLYWHGEVLSASNHRSLFIPEGFAHGFQALCDDCELLYLHSAPYAPAAEGRINPLDRRLAIRWPALISGMSRRDEQEAELAADFLGVVL